LTVFKGSPPSSSDLPPGWAGSEFERYKEYMGDNWPPPADIGHNNPPECKDPLASLTPWQIYIDCIWISDEVTCTKIMLLCIARFMSKQLLGSSMSYSQIANDCGFSEPTAKRIGKKVRGVGTESRRRWLRVEVGKGRYVPGKGGENLYHGVIPQDLLVELRRRKDQGGVSHRYPEPTHDVSERYPETDYGVSNGDPEGERGITQIPAGYLGDTLTPHTPQREDSLSGVDAPSGHQCHFDSHTTLDDIARAEEGADAKGPLQPNGTHASKSATARQEAKVAFDLFVEVAKRCGLSVPRKVDPWLPNIIARLNEHGLDGWKQALANLERSPFLRGEVTDWRADLDWFVKPKNFAKVLSERYVDGGKPRRSGAGVF
jgi:hypothetical protein